MPLKRHLTFTESIFILKKQQENGYEQALGKATYSY